MASSFAESVTTIAWSGGFTFRLDERVPSLLGAPRYPKTPTVDPTPAGPNTTIYFPTSSDQCWDYALPCSPWVLKQTLRDPDSMASGFTFAPP